MCLFDVYFSGIQVETSGMQLKVSIVYNLWLLLETLRVDLVKL